MRKTEQRNIVPSAARTISGDTGDLRCPAGARVRISIVANIVSGTSPTLLVQLDGKNKSDNYYVINSSAVLTSAGNRSFVADYMPETYLIEWIIGGVTPSFTFDIDIVFETVD